MISKIFSTIKYFAIVLGIIGTYSSIYANEIVGGLGLVGSESNHNGVVPGLALGVVKEGTFDGFNYFALNPSLSILKEKDPDVTPHMASNIRVLFEMGNLSREKERLSFYRTVGLGYGQTDFPNEKLKTGLVSSVAFGGSFRDQVGTNIFGIQLTTDSSMECGKAKEYQCNAFELGGFFRILF